MVQLALKKYAPCAQDKQLKGTDMTNEISLQYLWKLFRAVWWKIAIIAVVVAIAFGAYTYVAPNEYSSSTSFYIINASITTEYTTSSLLSATEYLANDYIEIIHGDAMIQKILDTLKEKGYAEAQTLTPDGVRGMISSTTSSKSSIFTITVSCANGAMAHDICSTIQTEAPAIIKSLSRPSTTSNIYFKNDRGEYVPYDTKMECVDVVREATAAKDVSSSPIVSAFIGAVIAAIAAFAFFLVRKLFDNVLRTSNDIIELTDKPILADIPDWTMVSAAQKSNEN